MGRLPKGTIVERKIPTTWYIWLCPVGGCEVRLKSVVEKFVITGASNHQKKHERDRQKAATMKANRDLLEVNA